MRADIDRKLAEPTTLPFTVRRYRHRRGGRDDDVPERRARRAADGDRLPPGPPPPRSGPASTPRASCCCSRTPSRCSAASPSSSARTGTTSSRGRRSPAGREAGRRPAQPPPAAGRLAPRHRRLLDHGHRVARRPARAAATGSLALSIAGPARVPSRRVRRRRPAADRRRRAARAGGRPGAAHPAHRRQGRRARGHGRCAGRAHRRGARRQRRRRRGRRGRRAPRSRCSTGSGSTPAASAGVADALRQLVALPDPVGDVVRGSTLPNGLQLRQVRVPLGVVGIVYEARPNVTVDAAGLCLKSGNAALLRGSASAFRTNTALVAVLTEAGAKAGLPDGFGRAAARRPGVGRRAARTPAGWSTCVIPRGGAALIQRVVRESTVPVIETGVGNCHVYVDAVGRPRDGRGDRAELQDPPGQRLQLRRDAARAPRRRRSCRGCSRRWPTPA